jgi:hypothetical protein
MSRRKERAKLIPGLFVPLLKPSMATPAWRAMSFGARLVYVELRGKMNNDARNNGTLYLSCRLIAEALGTKSTRSVVRWLAELEHYGFVRRTREGYLGADGRGLAAAYRLTEYRFGTNPPTLDFQKWTGKPFVYTARRPDRKKQNPVSLGDTLRVPGGHIRQGSRRTSVCVPGGHIDEPAIRVPGGHISRISHPKGDAVGDPGLGRGSSSRAAAKAEGAGSSPAPEARPDLTTMVLGIVNAQLDELERWRESSPTKLVRELVGLLPEVRA